MNHMRGASRILRPLSMGIAVAILSSLAAMPAAAAAISADLETGAVFSSYNDVRIPGEGGTRISLTDELSTDPAAFARLRVSYRWNDKHDLSLLIAPLRLEGSGSVDHPVTFTEAVFPARTPLSSRYRFDSYRLSYRRDFHRTERLRIGIGLTAKLRDAAIELRGGGITAKKSNTGFVPLLNFALRWDVRPPVSVIFEGDAAAAPQGRAEDVFLGLGLPLGSRWAFRGGYRLLEGGVDVDEVYNFSLIHYVVFGVTAHFQDTRPGRSG